MQIQSKIRSSRKSPERASKKATRRRLRTILQGMMRLCGRLTRQARRVVLKAVSSGGFGEALVNLHRHLATV